jgi:hypothetical protein
MNMIFELADSDPAESATDGAVRVARDMRAELEALLFRAEVQQRVAPAIMLTPPDRARIAALVLRASEVFP